MSVSSATVTATASTNWLFLNWNGTVTNYTTTGNPHNPFSFTVTTNVTQTANFGQVTNGFVFLVLTNYTPPQVEIIGYVGPTSGTITIPSTIAGMPVTSIAPGALWWITSPKVHVPGSVTNIASLSIAAKILELAAATAALKALSADTAAAAQIRAEATYNLASLASEAGRTDEVRKYADEVIKLDASGAWAQRAYLLSARLPADKSAPAAGGITFKP